MTDVDGLSPIPTPRHLREAIAEALSRFPLPANTPGSPYLKPLFTKGEADAWEAKAKRARDGS